jgi:broad specificity phosphatase PhoE
MTLVRRTLFLLVALAGLSPAAVAQATRGRETVVFVVRHAEKASATDPDSPLSDAGRARAEALAAALRDAGVTDVFVTARQRTRLTAAPLASARELTMHVVPFGASTAEHAALVAKSVRALHGGAVLVVGHSNTVTAIIGALGGPSLPELCDAAYANLFIVRIPASGPSTLVRARYGADDNADPASCPGMTIR